MASSSCMSALSERLTCPICISIYNDPVTITCGHSFCRTCIDSSLTHRCPLCRESFVHSAYIPAFGIKDLCDVYYQQRKLSTSCTNCPSGINAVGACKRCFHALCNSCIDKSCITDDGESHAHDVEQPVKKLFATQHYSCPIHRSEEAEHVCITCEQPSCNICDDEGVHAVHKTDVIKRKFLPNHLHKKRGELSDALAEILVVEEKVVLKERSLRERISRMKEEVGLCCDGLEAQVHQILEQSRTSFLAHIDNICKQEFVDPLDILLKQIDTFKETFSIYGNLPVSNDNCMSVLRRQVEMQATLTSIATQTSVAREIELRYSLPDYSNLASSLKTGLDDVVKGFEIAEEAVIEMAHDMLLSPSVTVSTPVYYCDGSEQFKLVSILDDHVEFFGLSTWQIALSNQIIFLPTIKARNTGLLKLDIKTGTSAECIFSSRSRIFRGGLRNPVQKPNAVTVWRDAANITYFCIASFNLTRSPDAKARAVVIKADDSGALLSQQQLKANNPCGVCFGRHGSLFYVERETMTLFASGDDVDFKKLKVLCSLPGRLGNVLMAFDQASDKLWIKTGHSQLTEVTLSGDKRIFDLKECVFISGLAIDANGLLWVTDSSRQKLIVFRQSESVLTVVGEVVAGRDQQFHLPSSVAIDGDKLVLMDKLKGGWNCFYVYKGVLSFGS